MASLAFDSEASDLGWSDSVVLYPTFGRLETDGRTWQVVVRGVVSRPGRNTLRRRLVLRMLRRAMRAHKSDLERSDVFRQRVAEFLSATERGKQVVLRVGSKLHRLDKPSRRNGHFHGTLRLSRAEIAELEQAGLVTDGWLQLDVVPPQGDERCFSGRAQLIGHEGVSVISDIDDTIKHTEVTERRTMLTNTFLRQFEPVPGMAELYRAWSARGATFHYVSSSPWQLYEALQELCQHAGFPKGSFHLRAIRLRDPTVLRLFLARRWGKRRTIGRIVRSFPERRFVLVGDSGEKDPEIYGAIARRHPSQVAGIFIRRVPRRDEAPDRFDKAFRQVPPSLWRMFEHPGEIAEVTSGLAL